MTEPTAAVRPLSGFAEEVGPGPAIQGPVSLLQQESEKGVYDDTQMQVMDSMKCVQSQALRVTWDKVSILQMGVRPSTEGYATLRLYSGYLQIKDPFFETGEVVLPGELNDTIAAVKAGGGVLRELQLANRHKLGGFSGPVASAPAARACAGLADKNRGQLS